MRAYIIRRLLISIPLVFLMTFVIFAVINLNPQSALDKFVMNPNISFQVIEQEKERTGFYDSMPVRYAKWLSGVLFDIRLGRERHSLVSFAAGDDFADRFMVDTSEVILNGPVTLGADDAPVDLMTRDAAARRLNEVLPAIASYRFEVEYAPPPKPDAPDGDAPDGGEADDPPAPGDAPDAEAEAPKPMAVVTLTSPASGEPVTVEAPLAPGPRAVTLTAPQLKAAGVQGQAVDSLAVSMTGPGSMKVTRVVAVLDLYTIQKPAKRRPFLVTTFPAAGAKLTLQQPGSPYPWPRLQRFDWTPRGEKIDIDAEGKDIVAQIDFRELRIEVGNPGDTAATYNLVLQSGEPGALARTELPFELEPGQRRSVSWSLEELKKASDPVDLEQVRQIAVESTGESVLYVYRVELVRAMSPVSIGGWPNFGRSHKNIPVLTTLRNRVQNTVLLVVSAILLTWLVALPAGVVAAVRQYKLSDQVLSFVSFIGMAMPSFFLAVLVRYVIQEASDPSSLIWFLPDLPDSGRTSINYESLSAPGKALDLIKHAIAPVIVLAMGGMAGLQRIMRGTMLETQRQQFITTARAKGLSERVVIFKHALRNAITPFVAGFGSILPRLIGGSLFIELVFNYPGVGRLMYEAVLNRDLNLVMANTLIAALLLVLGNLVADILLAIVDPRVSYA